MAFKVLLVIVISLYVTEAAVQRDKMLGGADYLPCKDCDISKNHDAYPKEGRMTCFQVKRTTKEVLGRVKKCKTIVCDDPFDFFCIPKKICNSVLRNVTVLDCELVRKWDREISQQNETFGTIYQINSPHYFGYEAYPENTYCIWNIADKDLVTYRIIDQQLQNASDCDGPGCDCPDTMMVRMGANEVKLCGSTMPPMVNHLSSEGLQVKFCSDHMHTAKGVLLMAYRHNNQQEMTNNSVMLNRVIDNMASRKRRQQPPQQPVNNCDELIEKVEWMSNNMSEMGCQYEMMMRMSQPGVNCPDDQTIVSLLSGHKYLMSDYTQTMPMCDGMEEMTTRMPMMNNIESCAVDYLYRTRDCTFAASLLDTSVGELNDVARMIHENNFPIKVPKELNIERTNCKRERQAQKKLDN